jgi:hypothetical protein
MSLSDRSCMEYKLFLEVWRYQAQNQRPNDSLQRQMKEYFVKMWKAEFPFYQDDPFRTLLAVYILDRILELSVWEPSEVQQLKAKTLKPFEDKISQRADLKARWIVVLFTLTIGTGLSSISYYFFSILIKTDGIKAIWQDTENMFFFFGGTVPTFLFLVGLLLFLLKKEDSKWRYRSIHAALVQKITRRMRRRFGLPIA